MLIYVMGPLDAVVVIMLCFGDCWEYIGANNLAIISKIYRVWCEPKTLQIEDTSLDMSLPVTKETRSYTQETRSYMPHLLLQQ